jgi:DNA-directed RNA polymerase specialized sigma24 family protein
MTQWEGVELVPITPKLEHGLPSGDDVEDNASLSEAQYRLESWILYEAPRERRMLRMFFLEGASAPVIARKMKCNRALVYTIIRRFRERHGLVRMEVKDAA